MRAKCLESILACARGFDSGAPASFDKMEEAGLRGHFGRM